MYLVADRAPAHDNAECETFAPWRDFPISYLSHHGGPCCETARQWFRAMDFAQLNGSLRSTGPRWIREKFSWGPSVWPLYWCEALEADSIDCGAHAALAEDAFTSRGLTVARAQFVQRYSVDAVRQWSKRWDVAGASPHWLDGDTIYHEGNAVAVGNAVKLWDGSSGSWLNPKQTAGYGGVIAVRITPVGANSHLTTAEWGEHSIPTGEWWTPFS